MFLKRTNTDDANCSKIEGYVIKITRNTDNTDANYTHNTERLSQDKAKKNCQLCAQVCTPFSPGMFDHQVCSSTSFAALVFGYNLFTSMYCFIII